MTVSTAYSVLSFAGNGVTTEFAVTWPFFTGSLVVTLVNSSGVETVKTLTTHYTVSGGTDSNGLPATGTVTMLTAPATGETLRIQRSTPKTQAATWGENDAFPQKTIESALDKLLLIAQEGGNAGTVNDGITGDVLSLVSSGATDYWDAESQIIRGVATPTGNTDATPKLYVDEAISDAVFADVGSFTQNGTGAVTRTYLAKNREIISVADFGAVGDGTSRPLSTVYGSLAEAQAVYPHASALTQELDWAAAQAAINYLDGLSTRGGVIFFPRGKYILNDTLTISDDGLSLVGEGVGSVWVASSWGAAPTDLQFDHTTGACIRIKASSVKLEGFRVSAGATRSAASAGSNYGVQMEHNDTGASSERVNACTIEGLHVIEQPNHGIALIGDSVSCEFRSCTVTACGGHGFVVDRGEETGRSNVARPGIVRIINCRSNDNDGHGLCVGTPSSSTSPPYRVEVNNFESYRNALSAGVRHVDHDSYVYGENITITASAFAGYDSGGTENVGSGLFVAGRNIILDNLRLVSTNVPLTIGTETGMTTNGVAIRNPYIGGGSTRPVAVVFESGITNVHAHVGYVAGFTAFTATASNVIGLWRMIDKAAQFDGTFGDLISVISNDSVTSGQIKITQSGSGDATVRLTAGADWSIGVDNSVSDQFAIQPNTSVNSSAPFAISTAGVTYLSSLDLNDDSVRVRTSKTPSSASDTGTQGEIAWDSSYVYVCVATNTWKRAAIATW